MKKYNWLLDATQKFVHFGQKKAILNVRRFFLFMRGFTWGVAILTVDINYVNY